MRDLVSGLIVAGYLVSGLFFLRFWTATRDRLFLIFGLAFGLLALKRTLMVYLEFEPGREVWLYGLRLLGFVLILLAILDKNRSSRSASPPHGRESQRG